MGTVLSGCKMQPAAAPNLAIALKTPRCNRENYSSGIAEGHVEPRAVNKLFCFQKLSAGPWRSQENCVCNVLREVGAFTVSPTCCWQCFLGGPCKHLQKVCRVEGFALEHCMLGAELRSPSHMQTPNEPIPPSRDRLSWF